jgi:hypothetical protein
MTAPISMFRRDSEPFEDARVETYARCRARGVAIRKASEEAGIATATAQKLEKADEFRERMRELKDATQAFTGITLAAIMQRLLKNADAAHDAGDFKGSNQALAQLTTLVKEDAGRVTGSLRNIGARHGEKQVREGFRALLEQPEMVETTGEDANEGDPT